MTAYKIAAWPAEARKAVWARDKGVCGICGLDLSAEGMQMARSRYPGCGDAELLPFAMRHAPKWQADHIVELVDSDRSLAHWSLENQRVLCHACHAVKSAASRRARAKASPLADTPK